MFFEKPTVSIIGAILLHHEASNCSQEAASRPKEAPRCEKSAQVAAKSGRELNSIDPPTPSPHPHERIGWSPRGRERGGNCCAPLS